MSDPILATYHFLPWVRRGVSAAINNPDSGPLPAHASLNVQLDISAQQPNAPATDTTAGIQVQMYGPGDVLGIDPRHIIRTEPPNFTPNYEPNYLAGIEFDQPDFPWLFTPAAPNVNRLRPWLSLIVLQDDEFTIPPGAPNPLPVILVTQLNALQNLNESWNWAHAQISGDLDLNQAISHSPGAVLSRMLCPRRLDPETHYTAFLVPAFELGRRAGLGEDVSGVAIQAMSWASNTTGPLKLPVHYRFEFHTSDAGDFESLVRRLTPHVLIKEVGIRAMAVDQPMTDFPSAGPPLGLEGALLSPNTQSTDWKDPDKQNFQTKLQQFISVPASNIDDPQNPHPDDPRIVPPIYARWHAAIQAVDPNVPGWVNKLNLDPRPRVMAGMGTRVVLTQRVQLMASAWQQLEGIERTNQLLRQAQLARACMLQAYKQHFLATASTTLLALTASVHSRMFASPRTVHATITRSRLPVRALSATFRRIARPLGPLRRRQGSGTAAPMDIVERLNSGEVTVEPPIHPPGGMVSIDQVSDKLYPSWVPEWLRPWLQYATWFLLGLAALLLFFATFLRRLGLVGKQFLAAVTAILGIASALVVTTLATRSAVASWAAAAKIRFNNITPSTVSGIPPRPTFTVTTAGQPQPTTPAASGDSPDAQAFRAVASEMADALQAPAPDRAQLPPLDIEALRTTILARLDPNTTIPSRLAARVKLPPNFNWHPVDPIEPIMAAPKFPQPMYEPLRDFSQDGLSGQDFLLPGLQYVPPDTLGLLETNHAFIEAYMVGLNHEMGRQLLWNGYPTDQRGSYFRQFWDVRAYVPTPSDPTDPAQLHELLKDIPPVHTWPRSRDLGQNENRTDIVPNNLVLLVRGELLRRYPNAIIYACEAVLHNGKKELSTDEKHILFSGTLSPDLTFFGFNLTKEEARGNQQYPHGWFFVFQEHPSEPRFGLEPEAKASVKEWNDLAWTNFSTGSRGSNGSKPSDQIHSLRLAREVASITARRIASTRFAVSITDYALPAFLPVGVQPHGVNIVAGPDNQNDKNNAWGKDSAQTAYITLRRPFRIAVHAETMLPR